MSRINLLPPEIRKERANAVLARRIRFLGLVMLLLLGGLYGVRTFQVIGLRSELEDVRAQQASVQSQIDALGDVAAKQASVESARSLVSTLTTGDISWCDQMMRLATTIPAGFKVSSIAASVNPGSVPIVGSMTFSATSSDYVPTESWLVRLAAEEGWANAWVGSLADSGQGTIGVSGSVDLTEQAFSARGSCPL